MERLLLKRPARTSSSPLGNSTAARGEKGSVNDVEKGTGSQGGVGDEIALVVDIFSCSKNLDIAG